MKSQFLFRRGGGGGGGGGGGENKKDSNPALSILNPTGRRSVAGHVHVLYMYMYNYMYVVQHNIIAVVRVRVNV